MIAKAKRRAKSCVSTWANRIDPYGAMPLSNAFSTAMPNLGPRWFAPSSRS